MMIAFALIVAGVAMTAFGDEVTGAVLVSTGLTVGGFTQGLHTPAPIDEEDLGRLLVDPEEGAENE
jgi:hypothetical protein